MATTNPPTDTTDADHANANHEDGSFPLPFAATGETVVLVAIRAEDKMRHRLTELGLSVGMCVRVVQGDAAGPLILAVKNDTRLAIGRGMAQKIFVRRAGGRD